MICNYVEYLQDYNVNLWLFQMFSDSFFTVKRYCVWGEVLFDHLLHHRILDAELPEHANGG